MSPHAARDGSLDVVVARRQRARECGSVQTHLRSPREPLAEIHHLALVVPPHRHRERRGVAGTPRVCTYRSRARRARARCDARSRPKRWGPGPGPGPGRSCQCFVTARPRDRPRPSPRRPRRLPPPRTPRGARRARGARRSATRTPHPPSRWAPRQRRARPGGGEGELGGYREADPGAERLLHRGGEDGCGRAPRGLQEAVAVDEISSRAFETRYAVLVCDVCSLMR